MNSEGIARADNLSHLRVRCRADMAAIKLELRGGANAEFWWNHAALRLRLTAGCQSFAGTFPFLRKAPQIARARPRVSVQPDKKGYAGS